jgi:hypothetical protein
MSSGLVSCTAAGTVNTAVVAESIMAGAAEDVVDSAISSTAAGEKMAK